MKSSTILLITIALLNYASCQEFVQLTQSEWNADQAAQDTFNDGWQALVQDAIENSVFNADNQWSNILPKCTFKKNIEGGADMYFIGTATNQNGDTLRYLIMSDYLNGAPVLKYYSYYFKDMFVSKHAGDQLWVEVTTNDAQAATVPEAATAELAPEEEIPDDFEAPVVDVVVEEEQEVEVEDGGEQQEAEVETETQAEAEVEIEVEIDADADPLAGYLPIDISSLENYPQGKSALDEGFQLAVENMVANGEIPDAEDDDRTLNSIEKAYLKVVDGGIMFYFLVTMSTVVDDFTLYAVVEYYVLQDAEGVNKLESYRLGDQWANMAVASVRN